MKACNFDNKHHINNQIKSPFQAILAYKTVSNLCFYRAKHQTEQSAKIVTDVVSSVCVSLCESVSVSVGKKLYTLQQQMNQSRCPKLLFIVCCTAFSIHIRLFTRGAILLGIESAPLMEKDED